MRVVLMVAWLALAAPFAWAQTVVVRSGEHGDFTRLTFAIPAGAEWSLRDTGARPRLAFSLPDVAFDLTTVFRRIDRTRLRSLRDVGGAVEFELACDCVLSAFDAGPALVAIDIRDRTGERVPAFFTPRVPRQAYRFADMTIDRRPLPGVQVPQGPRDATPLPARLFPGTALLPALSGTLRPRDVLPDARIDRARDALLFQIGRAATKGMIETSVPIAPPVPTQTAAPGSREPPRPLPINLNATTAIDAAVADRKTRPPALTGVTCLPDDAVALHDWAGRTDFATSAADFRARLYGEFDAIDGTVAGDLARLYLHYGFGSEALQLLALLPEPDPGLGPLADMARIIEGDPATGAFDGQAQCDGDVALWSILAVAGSPQDPVPATAAVERAFQRLPPRLQTLLGERVAARLTGAGADAAADRVLRRILRATPPETPASLSAGAALAAARDAPQEREAGLLALARAEAPGSAAAAVELADALWSDRRPPPADLLALTASFATEMRRMEEGPDLRLAQVRLLALSGDFDTASAHLPEIGRRDGPGAAQRAQADLLSELARTAADVDLLRHALTAPMPVISALPDAVGNRLAERLIDLGFPAPAEQFLQPPARAPDGEARLRLRARAAIARGDLQRAALQLSGASDPEADRLRAEVLRRNGDFAAAADLLRPTDGTAADRLDWLAGRAAIHDQAATVPDRLFVAPAMPDADGDLAAATGLIDRSREIRADIDDLLSRHLAPVR
jgi:hypothetical protein